MNGAAPEAVVDRLILLVRCASMEVQEKFLEVCSRSIGIQQDRPRNRIEISVNIV
jgi:hypothetical protein